MALITRITDGDRVASIDHKTNALIVIDNEHYEIHEGDTYRLSASDVVGSGNSFNLVITTPASAVELHFVPTIVSANVGTVTFYELAEAFTGGSTVTPRNANRRRPDASVASVKEDATLNTTNAITLVERQLGASGSNPSEASPGAEAESRGEWILAAGTDYAIVFDNDAGVDNDVTIVFSWYEHTPSTA